MQIKIPIKKYKIKNNKKFIKLVVFVFCIFIIINFLSDFWGFSSKTQNVKIEVKNGDSINRVANELYKINAVKYPLIFKVYAKIFGFEKKLKYGTHIIDKNASYNKILKTLTEKAKGGSEVLITIPEGFELSQIADTLSSAGLVSKEKFYDACENYPFEYSFLKNIPKRKNRLEGYLFPDSYNFYYGMSEDKIIKKMLDRFDEVIKTIDKSSLKNLGLSLDQAITLASIIEREAKGDEDRYLVSSVFHNRLKSKQYPYLQSCATVQYILGERKPVLSNEDTKIQSPYNTYINKGLPIGPIASPGKKSIEAAINPQKSDYYFFVLDKNGKHIFTKTLKEHLKASNN